MTDRYASEFNDKLRWEIRVIDGLRCFLCGRLVFIWELHVHHIDYDKRNTDPDNLISLCDRCHGYTNNNINRIAWTAYFRQQIVGRMRLGENLFIDDDIEYIFED